MRTKGKITHWNREKGYGFITPEAGAKRVFVHARAFSNPHALPAVGQLVSFELSADKQGRPCAVSVTRAGEKPVNRRKGGQRSQSIGGVLASIVAIAVLGAWAYSRFEAYRSVRSAPLHAPVPRLSVPADAALARFRCDGRTYCSQMTSCEEAKYFVRNCSATQMDGDHDGVPCEQQWCRW